MLNLWFSNTFFSSISNNCTLLSVHVFRQCAATIYPNICKSVSQSVSARINSCSCWDDKLKPDSAHFYIYGFCWLKYEDCKLKYKSWRVRHERSWGTKQYFWCTVRHFLRQGWPKALLWHGGGQFLPALYHGRKSLKLTTLNYSTNVAGLSGIWRVLFWDEVWCCGWIKYKD